MEYYVYVLVSEKNGYRYIGQTNNLERRFSEHNLGLTKSIRFQLPFRLIYKESFNTRTEALKERKILEERQGKRVAE